VRIGLLSPVTGGFFFGGLLAGVVREAALSGARVTLVQTFDAGESGDPFLQEVDRAHPVAWDQLDGFLVSPWATNPEYLRSARRAGKPLVLVATATDAIDASSVVIDNEGGTRALVEHLADHGHTRIVFVGNTAQSDIAERHAAYRAAMTARGIEPLPLVNSINQSEPGGDGASAEIAALQATGRCTAVVASTDRIALGLLAGLRRAGLTVPEDVALVGFDDIEAGWYSTPQLTTVRQRFDDLAAVATTTLLAEVADPGRAYARITVPVSLVVRGSCGCPATVEPSADALAAAAALVSTIEQLIAQDAPGRDQVPPSASALSAARRALDATVTAAVEVMLRSDPTPEDTAAFTHAATRALMGFATAARLSGGTAGALAEYAVARITATFVRLRAGAGLARIEHLSVALGEQYDVGMGLLGDTEGDPADLRWLARVGVTAACLGLWGEGAPTARLVVGGVYEPAGTLDRLLGTAVTVEQFPPLEVLDLADASTGEVAYVIPVRGATGDHGLLCLVGRVEAEFATNRATYDHWAALLGAALREKGLLADVRHSEERYATAARAANDGLWEWSQGSGQVYVSEKCRDLLGLAPDAETDSERLIDQIHPDDREVALAALTPAAIGHEARVELECRIVRPDGVLWVLVRALSATSPLGIRGLVGSISDISERKELESQLRQAALFDPVTGLPNRRLFLDRLATAMGRPSRRSDARFAVLFLDLDGFKLINDSLGHLAGDELLRVVGERLAEQVRCVDTAARFGGDEFALLLTDPVPDDLLLVARRIQARVADPILLGDQEISITASLGIAASETVYADAEEVLRDADIAMYRAKESERGTACVFDPQMHERAVDRLRTRSALTAALEAHEFVVHYQPIVDLGGADLTRFEALVRWEHPQRGLLLPAEFLPAMDGNATIVALGRQVLDQVCAQVSIWRGVGSEPVDVHVSVNVSHREFWDPDLLTVMRATAQRHQVPPSCLVLEITESVVMTDPAAARAVLRDLRTLGVGLHIDDFGTGTSSLHALRTLPVDAIKIDGSFIRELGEEQSTALVRAIVAMGAALGLDVVAECVETAEQADQLRSMGCDTAQGWLYARALPPDDAGALLGRRLADPSTEPPTRALTGAV
jgi:diguanylate cyclase (GGDEF)-like protein/PAS domain S-box-containing protein